MHSETTVDTWFVTHNAQDAWWTHERKYTISILITYFYEDAYCYRNRVQYQQKLVHESQDVKTCVTTLFLKTFLIIVKFVLNNNYNYYSIQLKYC